MEWTIGILLSLLTLYLTFKYDWKKKPVEEKNTLLVLFKATQAKHKEVRLALLKLIEHFNAWDSEMFPGISYKTYLNKLEMDYSEKYSDEMYNILKTEAYSKSDIELLMRELQISYEPLKELLAEIQLKSNF